MLRKYESAGVVLRDVIYIIKALLGVFQLYKTNILWTKVSGEHCIELRSTTTLVNMQQPVATGATSSATLKPSTRPSTTASFFIVQQECFYDQSIQ